MSDSLKADTASSHNKLMKGLKDLGKQISCKVAIAIAMNTQHANNVNQASLQAFIDLLQNHESIHVGTNPSSPTSATMPNTKAVHESFGRSQKIDKD